MQSRDPAASRRSGTADEVAQSIHSSRTAASVKDLGGAWEFAELPPGHGFKPGDLTDLLWRPAIVPGTVAGALRALGGLDAAASRDLDAREFVYRRKFRHEERGREARLVFDGLATIANVWLNGNLILETRSMFREYSVDVGPYLQEENELLLHFRALAGELARKRPRGRWKTRLAAHRNLRHVRTTLLGRMPGWSPLCAPVGPCRGVRLEHLGRLRLSCLRLRPTLEGTCGVLAIGLKGRTLAGDRPAALEVRIGDQLESLPVLVEGSDEFRVESEVRVPEVAEWWTHDLGEPRRYAVSLRFRIGEETTDLGTIKVGFRRIELCGGAEGDFRLRLNGRDIFCRGACWTPTDPIALTDDPAELRRVLVLARDAGMNMLRVNGTMLYETEAFFDACDEIGVLVWQDFMFARMDYPELNDEFAIDVRHESEQVLARIHHHPCLAVLCGNSEVEQQAAMMGLPPDSGRTPLFCALLRDASRLWCPEIPYLSSSPTGGALPFHADSGIAHYFGVGAYLRPLADARECRVRFASECLAFSNVPEDAALEELLGEEPLAVHAPIYKAGVPRDSGAGWDFADVTDHYVEELFGCNVRELRHADSQRYLALARVASGEMMEKVMGLWRAEGSTCSGALVWFLRDLMPGSGWGVLDRAGRPKPAYWFLKRACAPRAIWLADEGLNGLQVHACNDGSAPFVGLVRVRLIRDDGLVIHAAEAEMVLERGSGNAVSVDRLLGRFTDANHAYRFGPCEHAIVVAELVDASGTVVATANYLPTGLRHDVRDDIGLRAVARAVGKGMQEMRIESTGLALFVRITAEGFSPSDNYFHVAPGEHRIVLLRPSGSHQALHGSVAALNARTSARVGIQGLTS